MADYFGNRYWTARYFEAGYWGVSEAAPEGSISASLSGGGNLSGGMVGIPTVVVSTSGGGKVRDPYWRFPYYPPRPVPAHMQASLRGASAAFGRIGGIGELRAALAGEGIFAGDLEGINNPAIYDAEFWLYAA